MLRANAVRLARRILRLWWGEAAV